MSWGSAGPSTIVSPLLTTCPSCTVTCLSFGIRYSWAVPSKSVMIQALLALGVLAERDRAGDFRQQARVLRGARLEELRHARQAARDVARLGRLLRDTRSTSPTLTCAPFFTVMMAPIWNV
jgi:hypothetical protein